MEASAHFLENPKNSSSSQLVPITAMKDKQEEKRKDMKRPKQLQNTGPSQKLITGFLGVSFSFIFICSGGGREHCALPASSFFSSHLIVFMLGVSDVRFVWTELM